MTAVPLKLSKNIKDLVVLFFMFSFVVSLKLKSISHLERHRCGRLLEPAVSALCSECRARNCTIIQLQRCHIKVQVWLTCI